MALYEPDDPAERGLPPTMTFFVSLPILAELFPSFSHIDRSCLSMPRDSVLDHHSSAECVRMCRVRLADLEHSRATQLGQN